jgi:hypothetical protein
MFQSRSTLAKLCEELRTIEVFDRIHEYASGADPANDHLCGIRQVRRREIAEKIARLRAHKPASWKPAGVSGAIAFACAVGCAVLYYSLR